MIGSLVVPIVRLPHAADLPLPTYATDGAAGLDLQAAIADDLEIKVQGRVLVPTGISIAIPRGFEAQVRPRSGLAVRHGLTVLNTPGTIDSDYRGEIMVLLINLGVESVQITRGMRIAQLVFAPVVHGQWTPVVQLPESGRGVGGFGSTGT